MIKVACLIGSLRRESWNRKLMAAALECLAALPGVEAEIIEISELPLVNEDLEKPALPGPVAQFKQRMAAADAFVFATPEYNHSVSAPLKNAIDWASRPPANAFGGKPFVVMSATVGAYGGIQGNAATRHTLAALGGLCISAPLVTLPLAGESFEADGKLKNERTCAAVEAACKRLVEVSAALANGAR